MKHKVRKHCFAENILANELYKARIRNIPMGNLMWYIKQLNVFLETYLADIQLLSTKCKYQTFIHSYRHAYEISLNSFHKIWKSETTTKVFLSMLNYDRKSYKVWVNIDSDFHIRSTEDLLRGNNIKMYSCNIFKHEP